MLLQHLMDFGENVPKEVDLNYDLDITDKENLETQINIARKSYRDLIAIHDELQGQYLKIKSQYGDKSREIIVENENKTTRLDVLKTDDDLALLSEKVEAIKESLKIIGMQIDFVKSDLALLRSSMYNKF